jgi:hypothetical protein
MRCMAKPAKVRLYPLYFEQTLLVLVDLFAWMVVYGVLRIAVGMSDWPAGFAAIGAAALTHLAQMAVAAVRFDDTAITITRPWRRRRVEWSRIAGLIYTEVGSGRAGRAYWLRLVLKGTEPPVGKYLTQSDLRPSATGPVVMRVAALEEESEITSRSMRCRDRIGVELARHGFPLPERSWVFRSPDYTDREADIAAAINAIGLAPVTVTHGPLAGDPKADLVATALPELARANGVHEIDSYDGYTIFTFDGGAADEHADAFRTAAEEVVPGTWTVDRSALPAVEPE